MSNVHLVCGGGGGVGGPCVWEVGGVGCVTSAVPGEYVGGCSVVPVSKCHFCCFSCLITVNCFPNYTFLHLDRKIILIKMRSFFVYDLNFYNCIYSFQMFRKIKLKNIT